jgi:putative hydrolase of HD superfamily
MESIPQQQIDELIDDLVLPFYALKRDMLVPPENLRNENDAEHSWSLAVLACSMAEHIDPKLEVGLVAQFALVHDLTEIYAKDTSVWADDSELETKEEREAAALNIIKEKFAKFPWLINTLAVYESMESSEAKFVRAMDKFIALLIRIRDEGKFYHLNKISKEKFNRNLGVHRRKAQLHPGVAEYYEKIREEFDRHPEYFYKEGLS